MQRFLTFTIPGNQKDFGGHEWH